MELESRVGLNGHANKIHDRFFFVAGVQIDYYYYFFWRQAGRQAGKLVATLLHTLSVPYQPEAGAWPEPGSELAVWGRARGVPGTRQKL